MNGTENIYTTANFFSAVVLTALATAGDLTYLDTSGPTTRVVFSFAPAWKAEQAVENIKEPGHLLDVYHLSNAYELTKKRLNDYKKGKHA